MKKNLKTIVISDFFLYIYAHYYYKHQTIVMKTANLFLVVILLATAGCGGGGGNKQSTDDLIIVDVTKSYPKKELILQDFMDVEYILLETTDETITQGVLQAVGKDIIIVKNAINDGNIFIFDRTGKGLRKINRKGQGGEEYSNILTMILDEDNAEMFVNNSSTKKILVYDLYGNFKRSFKYKNELIRHDFIFQYDLDYLIAHESTLYVEGVFENERNTQSFYLISKQDGKIDQEIEIPYKKGKYPWLMDGSTGAMRGSIYFPMIKYNDNWILISSSSDTVFRYLPDYSLVPFIVRTPSIQSMDPETFLFPSILTDRYYFMESIQKDYNLATSGFPSKNLMYDKQEKTIYEYTVYNDDFTDRTVNMSSRCMNDEIIAFYERLEAFQLVEAYKKGQLKGRLKDIAATLDEEDNPVIMLVKHRK